MIATLVNLCLLIALTGMAGTAQICKANTLSQKLLEPTQSIPPDTTITLRSVWNFEVRISADGSVDFEGTTFEVDIANLKSKLGPDEMKGLVRAFERARYFELRDKYDDDQEGCPKAYTDSGSVITSFRMNGRFKSIEHYQGCRNKDDSIFPAELAVLEEQVEDAVNLRWRRWCPIPPDAMITLSEEGLLIKIDANGAVAVEGQTFDFDIGQIKTKISSEEVRDLIQGFEGINFFSLKDRYRDQTDGCHAARTVCSIAAFTPQTISLTLDGRSKSVTHYPYGCLEEDGSPRPRRLVALEHHLREVIDLRKR